MSSSQSTAARATEPAEPQEAAAVVRSAPQPAPAEPVASDPGKKPAAAKKPATEKSSAATPKAKHTTELYAAPVTRLITPFNYALVAAVLAFGWFIKDARLLTPESGLGYALGIVGGVMMLLLLLYPARKKWRRMRNWGLIKYWFRSHMVLGILGPVLVLYHANFDLGSLNSTVALFSTLLVAFSGIVGRYMYTKVHYGLYGRKSTLTGLREDLEANDEQLEEVFFFAPDMAERLHKFEQRVVSPPRNVLHSIGRLLLIGIHTKWIQFVTLRQLKGALKQEADLSNWSRRQLRQRARDTRRYILVFLATARRVVEFSFYERMFALWHVLHFPLFLLLIVAAVVHVVAVHMY